MKEILLVGAGGLLGSVSRYLVSGWVQRGVGGALFPWGTLAVNLVGCLVIGLLTGLVEVRQLFSAGTRVFLLIGFLGAFTTFSTFGYETYGLARGGEGLRALGNVGLQLAGGLVAVWLGDQLARLLG